MRETGTSRFRWKLVGLACAPAGLLAMLFAGCDDLPGRPTLADRPVEKSQIKNFDLLYRENCAACHGADGEFGPAPPLHDPLFLAIVSEEELVRTISRGRPGTPMPAFAGNAGSLLTDVQVKILAGGIKQRWHGPAPTEAVPPYAESDSKLPLQGDELRRAAQIFDQACATCHGQDGRGFEGDGSDAINDRDFLALISDQALRRIIITGRPDLGMPNFAGSTGRADGFKPLTSDEIADLVALLASWRAANGQGSQPSDANSLTK